MIQKSKILLLIVIPIFLNFTQTKNHIEGFVLDNYIESIENVVVKTEDATTKTDAKGHFILDTEQNYPIKITFSKEGYETKEIELKEESKELKVVLEEEF